MIASKSFQNCSESDVPGYNDCPSFLFNFSNNNSTANSSDEDLTQTKDLKSRTSSGGSISYMYGKTRPVDYNNIPPPPTRRVSISKSSSFNEMQATKLKIQLAKVNAFTKEELITKINELFTRNTRLSKVEFEFYQKKIESNILHSLEKENTRAILSQFFSNALDTNSAKKLMTDWLIYDMSVSTWTPAFLKIYENSVSNSI